MAFSATRIYRTVIGSKIQEAWSVNFASVTSGGWKTGLSQVESLQYSPETTDDHGVTKKNSTDGSNSVAGGAYISGVTSNDVGTVVVTGY